MAAPACNSGDGNQAIFVGTFLQDGSAVALCEDCFPQFCAAVIAQTQGIDQDALNAAISGLIAAETAGAPGDPAEVAYPPHDVSHGAPSDEPPAAAPADEDEQAGWDMTRPPAENGRMSAGSPGPGTDTDRNGGGPPARSGKRNRTPAE